MNYLPLTPADADLREFPFMPLDVVRLRDSDIAAISSGDEFRCAVLLWCASWHQIPAASLPDDDIILAQLAGYGRVVKEWKKVREGSLRGWIKCSDGRLYHPVVAEKANEAWARKQEHSWKTECARIKKLNQRHETSIPFPTLDDFLSPSYVPPKASSVPELSPGTKAERPQGQGCNVPDVSPGKQHRQGEGQGEGQGQEKPLVGPASDTEASGPDQQPPQGETPTGAKAPANTDTPHPSRRGTRLPADWQLPKAWGEWALAEFPSWTVETVRAEADKFGDHWRAKAGRDAVKLDWPATWRNWCRNARPGPSPAPAGGDNRLSSAGRQTAEAVKRLMQREGMPS